MNDALLSLIKIAGITLLITVLWALTLGAIYWDIHRRQQAGQRVNGLAWLAVAAFIPFIGPAAYLATRLLSGFAAQKGPADAAPVRRSETRAQVNSAARRAGAARGLPAIHADTLNKGALTRPPGPVPAAPPGPPQFQFSITRGPGQGKTFLVERFPVQIGRGIDSFIRLDQDESVSRRHAQVYQGANGLRIRDLGSRHGTRINGKTVTDRPLKPGDRIEVGGTTLSCKVAEG